MQGTARSFIGVDPMVDALMADGGFPVRLEVSGDLLRAPGLGTFRAVHGPSIGGNSRDILTRS